KIARVALFAVIFMALINSPAAGDIGIVVRVAFSKVQTVSEDNVHSERIAFEDGKAVWPGFGDYYFAVYNDESLKNLVQDDSTKVILAPYAEGAAPSFGNLYLVLKNILGGVGIESYGLNADTFYVWLIKFPIAGKKSGDADGVIFYRGIAPFGDMAIENIKKNGKRITKDFFTPPRAQK
ncbi:MAG: hypothetical protein WC582_03810, partial [Patescibacteria group bacterium]